VLRWLTNITGCNITCYVASIHIDSIVLRGNQRVSPSMLALSAPPGCRFRYRSPTFSASSNIILLTRVADEFVLWWLAKVTGYKVTCYTASIHADSVVLRGNQRVSPSMLALSAKEKNTTYSFILSRTPHETTNNLTFSWNDRSLPKIKFMTLWQVVSPKNSPSQNLSWFPCHQPVSKKSCSGW
jgi:hypothetical protein